MKGMRDDVKALELVARAARAAAIMEEEKNKPNLELFTNYALNGKNIEDNKVIANSVKTDKPAWTIGISLTAPLDFKTVDNLVRGHRLEADGAEKIYERKLFEQKKEWKDLVKKFVESKDRVALSCRIEEIQKKKLDYERKRHLRGRSTLYQVLMFEQEYVSAQIAKLMRLGEVLQLVAQMRTFEASTQ
ncbi:MAG: TolC family protein [Oligoflexales bacterium]|nr:TolC family protein [Oligoflexales bacterium]